MNKYIISAVAAVVICIAIIGGYSYPKAQVSFLPGSTNNAAGTVFNTAKVAQIDMAPATAAASSTSILNADSTDRWITSSFSACNTIGTSKTFTTGTGLVGWTMQMSTSSVSTQNGNTNWAANMSLSTSTTDSYIASTTDGVITGTSRVWPTNTYLTFTFNATNTAACTVGVHYLGS